MTDSTEPIRIDGRYLLEERLARGGSAEVWRARDEKLDRPVAVKLLHPHLVADEPARRRLAEEARLVASLRHPRIVQTYEVVRCPRWWEWVVAHANPPHRDRAVALASDLRRIGDVATADAARRAPS